MAKKWSKATGRTKRRMHTWLLIPARRYPCTFATQYTLPCTPQTHTHTHTHTHTEEARENNCEHKGGNHKQRSTSRDNPPPPTDTHARHTSVSQEWAMLSSMRSLRTQTRIRPRLGCVSSSSTNAVPAARTRARASTCSHGTSD